MLQRKLSTLNSKKELKSEKEIGFLKESIASVYETSEGSLYVLDDRQFRACKFSESGKLLLIFGNREQGPGDFLFPHRIYVTETNKIVICESREFISIFDNKGKFLKRLSVPVAINLGYLNENLF